MDQLRPLYSITRSQILSFSLYFLLSRSIHVFFLQNYFSFRIIIHFVIGGGIGSFFQQNALPHCGLLYPHKSINIFIKISFFRPPQGTFHFRAAVLAVFYIYYGLD